MINRFISEGTLPKTGNTVIRFDAHNDELIPEEMSALLPLRARSIRDDLYREYGKEVWMKEAVDEDGSLSHVIWVKPPWSLQVEDGHRVHAKGVTIDVKTIGQSIFKNDKEDFDGFEKIFKKYLTPGDKYILDLAFCFFSADNPFANEYEKSDKFYTIMKDIFKIPLYTSNNEKDIGTAVIARYTQLSELRKIFYYLHEHHSVPDPKDLFDLIDHPARPYHPDHLEESIKKIAELRDELLKHYQDSEIKWNYIYEYGIHASDYLCPVHHTSREDITKLIQVIGKLLDILQTPPSLIILGVMYDYDRYTPKKDLDFITKSLNEFFKSRYDINIEYLDY